MQVAWKCRNHKNGARRLEPRWWPTGLGLYLSGVGAVRRGNFLCVKTVCPCSAVRPGRRLGSIGPGTVGGPEPPEWAHPTQEIRVLALGWSQGCVFGETSTADALAGQDSRWGNGVQCTSRIQKSLGKKQKCRGNGWTKMFKYFLFINNIILFVYFIYILFIYTKDWKALTWSTLR